MRAKGYAVKIMVLLGLLWFMAPVSADNQKFEQEFVRARALESAGDIEQAIAGYEKLISQYPQQPEPYNNLAVLLAARGQLDSARERLEQAMRIDRIYATIYDNLSTVYVEMARGSYAKALQLGVAPRELDLKDVESREISTPVNAVALVDTATEPASAPEPTPTEPASTEPAAESSRSAPPATSPAFADEIKLTLQGWASAWSAQEVDLYLSFYAPAFKPEPASSRSRWEQLRAERLKSPKWINVILKDIQIEENENGKARVRFVQEYNSDSYNDITHKEVLLQSSSEGWRFLAERSL